MRKHRGWIVLICCAFLYFSLPAAVHVRAADVVGAAVSWVKRQVAPSAEKAAPHQSSTTSANTASTAATSKEAIVPTGKLAARYTYSFAPHTDRTVQQLFTAAINIYNQTGIVKLIPGSAGQFTNHLTLSSYQKVQTNGEAVILGLGGPQITRWTGAKQATVNHASARLNLAYRSRLNVATAVHELGHALGLAHSTAPDSVMFPTDRNVTKLSPADLAGLRAIYSR